MAVLDRRPGPGAGSLARPGRDSTRPLDPAHAVGPFPREEAAIAERARPSPAPSVSPQSYINWLERVSAKASRRQDSRLKKWSGNLGAILLLQFVFSFPVVGLLIVTEATLELQKDADRFGSGSTSVRVFYVVAYVLGSTLPPCWMVWKYGRD